MVQVLMGIDYSIEWKREAGFAFERLQLILYRQGEPAPNVKSQLVAYLDGNFPANNK